MTITGLLAIGVLAIQMLLTGYIWGAARGNIKIKFWPDGADSCLSRIIVIAVAVIGIASSVGILALVYVSIKEFISK